MPGAVSEDGPLLWYSTMAQRDAAWLGACQRTTLEWRPAPNPSFGAGWSAVRRRPLDTPNRPSLGRDTVVAAASKTEEVRKLSMAPFCAVACAGTDAMGGRDSSQDAALWFAAAGLGA